MALSKRKLSKDEASLTNATERILRAAENLFSEHGFDAASMNEVALRAGVSKANIFHHFGSKNALYLAVLKHACRQSADLLSALEQEMPALSERLAQFARAHLAHILERKPLARLIARELLQDNPRRAQQLAQQVFGENFAKLVELIRGGQRAGELRRDIDPATVAMTIIGANIFFFQHEHVLRHFPDVNCADDPARYSAQIMDVVLHGILQPKKKTH